MGERVCSLQEVRARAVRARPKGGSIANNGPEF